MAPTMHSDSEDERRAHDEDVLRDEDDAEQLLRPVQSGVRSWISKGGQDPNQPRPLAESAPREQRRQRRRERRMQRRGRRRQGGRNDDEAGLMFDGEEKAEDSDADSESATSSADDLAAMEKRPALRRGQKRFRTAIVLLAILGVLSVMVWGAYRASIKDTSTVVKGGQKLLSNGSGMFAPTTILVSLDGFRADFLTRNITPALSNFIKQGVSPKYMQPSFPSLTFPNHWTFVTGQYPESHGVVGNSFWDPALQEEFWYTDPARSMDPKWWTSTGAEPIWSTAEEQGVRAAVHMWPGSEAGIQPAPTYLDKYNGKESLPNKVARVLDLLDRPSELDEDTEVLHDEARPQLISFYVPNVDTYGHRYGPNSTEIREAIVAVDEMLGQLLDGLDKRNLTSIVNVVVVSDHGMATVDTSRLIQYEDLVNPDDIEHIDGWPLYGLRPKESVDLNELYVSLKGKTATMPQLQVYLRNEMPERWHFSASERIAPLWLIPDPGYAIVQKKDFDVTGGGEYSLKGLHGYDDAHPLMRAIFAARGPSFPHPPHSEVAVFQNIEVYGLICDTVGLRARPNNGTLRLPLKPLGVHGQEPHEGEQPADPPTETGEGEADNIEQHKDTTWWDGLVDKFKDTWGKIKDFFSSGGGEEVEVVAVHEDGSPAVEVIEEPYLVIGEDGGVEIVEEPVAVVEIGEQGG